MSPLPRPQASPGVLVRALVSLGAASAVAAAVAAYVAGRAVPGPGFGAEFATLVMIGALSRRYGVALPGNGYSSYILGVTAFAVLDRGWACAVLVGPTAMVAGDLMLRRLPPRAALVNAAHLTAGTAVVGLMYDRLGGVAGPDTFDPANLGPLVALLTLLPVVVNATFYLELALGRDRKSTRLNSSHSSISYAVFCWKKKTSMAGAAVSLIPAGRSTRSREGQRSA